MRKASDILKAALLRKQVALSEYESKHLLSAYGIPVVKEAIARDWVEAREIALQIGYPLVLKLCSPQIIHKTEQRLIELNLRDENDLKQAFHRLNERVRDYKGDFLIQQMIYGDRELVIGMVRDIQFGPCVMFGLGGIFTEILHDVSFRVAPIKMRDALEMMQEIKGHEILNSIRGMDAVNKKALGQSLIALGNIALEHEAIQEIDINPMIIQDTKSIAVDALVTFKEI